MTVTLQHPRYHFDRWIAGGGMGEVWQATDTLLDREVAVKVLRPHLAEDDVLRARFAAEARHAGALQHPHVASVLDYGEITGAAPTPLPFLVMELVEGQPLSALLAGGQPLPPRTAADLIAQAAEGIEAAHGIGIVHRDVKPGNLLVTAEGQVKVTDFGVARAADTASLTTTGLLIGTPHYISPEQAEGAAATTVSDVYSLGIVLYECLTGRKPFTGDTPVVTALMHIREPLPPFPDHVPERLRRITETATAKDPGARFRSAGAMAAALRDESPDTRTYLLPDHGTQSVAAVERRHRELMSARRVLAVLVALLLTAGGLWAMTGASEEPSGTPPAEASTDDAAELVRVRAERYLDRPLAAVRRELRDLGVRPRTNAEERPNPGGHEAGTVAGIDPAGLLERGTPVVLTVWAAPAAAPGQLEGTAGAGAGGSSTSAGGQDGRSQGGGGRPGGGQPASGAGGGGPGKAPDHSQAGGNGGGNTGPGGPGKGPGNGGSGGSGGGSGGGNSGGNSGGNGPGKGKR